MTSPTTSPEDPFDLDKLRELVALMEQHGLSEVDLRSGVERWRLRRGPTEVTQVVQGGGYGMMPYQPASAAPNPPSAHATTVGGPPAVELPAIVSPTVGTYYEAAAPGEAPFVKVGSRVTSDTVVCIIEAMKVFNQITADVNGTIAEVLVKNGDAVEFGQPLFRVRLG